MFYEHGRQIPHYRLYPLLGLKPGQHLPKEGFEPRVVEDIHGHQVTFMCKPASGAYSKHRIFYHCDACRKYVPFGRAAQHNKGKQHKLNYEIMVGRP